MPGPIVPVRCKTDINESIKQKKPRPLILPLPVEGHAGTVAVSSSSRRRSSHQYRAAEFLRTRGDIYGVQAVNNIAALYCVHNNVKRICGGINRRRAGNSYFRIDVLRAAHIAGSKRGCAV